MFCDPAPRSPSARLRSPAARCVLAHLPRCQAATPPERRGPDAHEAATGRALRTDPPASGSIPRGSTARRGERRAADRIALATRPASRKRASGHVPVLPRTRAATPCSRPALRRAGRRCVVDATLGLGGPRRGAAGRASRAARLVGIDRDPQALELAGRAAGAVRATASTLVHAVYDELPEVLAGLGLAARAGRAVRPRRLVAAARRGRPRLRLRARTPRWTCGWTRPAGITAADVAQHLRRAASSPASCASTARSGSPGGSPTRSSASATRARSRTSARLVELVRRRDPGGRPAHRRQPGQAHLPGAAHRGQRASSPRWSGRCPPRSTRSRSAAASSCCPTTRSRTGSSSAPSRRARAARRRRTCRSNCPSMQPRLRLLTRGGERPDAAEIAANPRAASARLRAAERIRRAA